MLDHQHYGSPLGLIGLTKLDVTAILGTFLPGLSIDTTFFFLYQFNMELKGVFEEHTHKVLKKKDQDVSKEEANKLR